MNKDEIYTMLGDIGLTLAEISVYVALLDGLQSVQEIIKKTGEKRPTAYYSLNSLEKRGLVSKTGKEYANKFQLEPIEKLSELVNRNIRKQEELLEKTKQLKDFYPKKNKKDKVLVSYFDTLESIKTALFFTLYGKEKTIRSIVPAVNFFHEIGNDFVKEYVREKKKKGLKTKALWEDIPNKKIIEEYYLNSDIKQFPLDMHNSFETTIFIYGDNTLYIAPLKECHATLIQSKAHAKMMNILFETIWKNSLII